MQLKNIAPERLSIAAKTAMVIRSVRGARWRIALVLLPMNKAFHIVQVTLPYHRVHLPVHQFVRTLLPSQ